MLSSVTASSVWIFAQTEDKPINFLINKGCLSWFSHVIICTVLFLKLKNFLSMTADNTCFYYLLDFWGMLALMS